MRMESDVHICPQCRFRRCGDELRVERCPKCEIEASCPNRSRDLVRIFWILFFVTPLLAFMTSLLQPIIESTIAGLLPAFPIDADAGMIMVAITGALGAGYFLAKSHSGNVLVYCAIHAFWMLLVYGFVAAIGCNVLAGNKSDRVKHFRALSTIRRRGYGIRPFKSPSTMAGFPPRSALDRRSIFSTSRSAAGCDASAPRRPLRRCENKGKPD
jgi:hypothetical protein